MTKELKHKVLVLITDGEEHEGDPLEVAKEAVKEGVVIYTIGIGSQQGAPIPEFDSYGNRVGYKKDRSGQIITTKLDVLTLEKIAFETGGNIIFQQPGNLNWIKFMTRFPEWKKRNFLPASLHSLKIDSRYFFLLH